MQWSFAQSREIEFSVWSSAGFRTNNKRMVPVVESSWFGLGSEKVCGFRFKTSLSESQKQTGGLRMWNYDGSSPRCVFSWLEILDWTTHRQEAAVLMKPWGGGAAWRRPWGILKDMKLTHPQLIHQADFHQQNPVIPRSFVTTTRTESFVVVWIEGPLVAEDTNHSFND